MTPPIKSPVNLMKRLLSTMGGRAKIVHKSRL